MSNETSPKNAAASPASSGEGLAAQFVLDQVDRSRASLRNTQVVGLVVIVIVLAYMGFVAHGLREHFQPKAAADHAIVVVHDQVQGHAADFAGQLKKVVPNFVAQLPDYLIKQLPVYRSGIEAKVSADVASYAKTTSAELAKQLDFFLSAHADKIKELLNTGQDLATVRQLAPDMEKTLQEYLKIKGEDGESIQEKFDHSLVALESISAHLDRLVHASDLTPNEKKLRQAIAVLLKKADWDAAKENK